MLVMLQIGLTFSDNPTLDDICNFFDTLTTNTKLSEKLRAEGVEPYSFQIFDKDDYVSMGFSKAESVIIAKFKTKIKKDPCLSPSPGDNRYQQLRRFLQPANQVTFT